MSAKPELLAENNHPVNQACKAKLGGCVDPGRLYFLQFALCGLEEFDLTIDGVVRYRLENVIGEMLMLPPKTVMRLLSLAEDGDAELAEAIRKKEPQEAAVEVLETIRLELC